MPRVEAEVAVKKATVDSDACDLDAATRGAIDALDARLARDDHYALLDIDGAAEKKAIKRAYFPFATKYHPDRFFGKKLGRFRAPLDRVFQRMTEAHEVLVDPARRAQYDRTLIVAMDPKNAAYRVTLAEIYVASDEVEQAAQQADEALEIDRGNARAKELSALVRKLM
jgi:curved DNA-binding protein CbpA